jgi:hypothetical protein
MDILDLSNAPDDNLERMIWLSGVEKKVSSELQAERERLVFEIRLQEQLPALLEMALYPPTTLLRWCRAENERRGRPIRWGDRLDRKSGHN